jgi:hypothetical protein
VTANNDDIIRRQTFEGTTRAGMGTAMVPMSPLGEQPLEGDSDAPTSRGYVRVAESERERRFHEELAEIESTYSQALSTYHVRKGMLYRRADALGVRLP